MGDDVRERIQKLLVTGDNRLKQGVSAEKVRQTYEEALAVAREAGLRTRSGRSSRSGSRISNGSLEDLLHPGRLNPEIVRLGGRAGGKVGARERRSGLEREHEPVLVLGVDQNPRLGRDELRRAADPRRDDRTRGRHRLERREAERLDEARLADDVRRGDPERHLVVAHPTGEPDPGSPLERRAKRAVADEGERPVATPLERPGEAEDVLPLREPAEAKKRSAVAGRPVDLGTCLFRRADGEPLEIDAAVDDRSLGLCFGDHARSRSRSQAETAITCAARRTT